MADDKKTTCPGGDTLQFGPQVGENARVFVRHRSDHTIQHGVAVCGGEGNDEASNFDGLLEVSQREDGHYNVESLWERGAVASDADGPAQVASPAFRSGWNRIFGNATVGQA